MSESDQFDDQLRSVEPPPGMAARLRAIPDWDDSDLDAQLATVDLPAGLLERLHDIVDDEVLDRALRNVPVSSIGLARAHQVAGKRQADWLSHPLARWALAASLIMVVWSGYLAGGMAILSQSRPASTKEIVWIDVSPVEIEAQQGESVAIVPETVVISIEPWVQAKPPYEPEASEPEVPVFVSLTETNPLAEVQTMLAHDADAFWRHRFAMSWDWLRDQSSPPAELKKWDLATIAPASTSPLWSNDRPRPHLFTIDRSPVFSPERAEQLTVSRPWLAQRMTTFDWAAARAAAGELPIGESIQAADFLAAIDYDSLEPEAGRIAWELNTTVLRGGLEHLGQRPVVLQIGLQAGEMPRNSKRPREILFAVDSSASMGAGRLEAVRTALVRMWGGLDDKDRACLVSFDEVAHPASPWLRARDTNRWLHAVEQMVTGGTGDLGIGLQAAVEQILERDDGSRVADRTLVLITDSDWTFNAAQLASLRWLTEELSRRDVSLQVVHMGPSGEARRLLDRVAEATGGQCVPAADAIDIGRVIATAIMGRDTTIAKNVEVTVRFDPKQVAAYRLVGDQELAILASNEDRAISLAAREAATAMYEIWLKPEAGGSPVTVEATWHNVASNSPVSRRRSLTVADLAGSSADVPDSLWLASLALATADAIRPRLNKSESLKRIDNVMAGVREQSTFARRADVRRMTWLLEKSREAMQRQE